MEHYHVEGPGFRCSVDIMTSELIIGDAPRKILAEARQWAEANRGPVARDVQGAEHMNEKLRQIEGVRARGPARSSCAGPMERLRSWTWRRF